VAVSVSHPRSYKGFTLTARTFQVRGSGRWTLDVLIARHRDVRSFSSGDTFQTEQDATTACWQMACRIIDRSPRDCRVSDLASEDQPRT
jgi:hypothetical protein